jgi:16S rRNA G966 N2-methylase RsmD
LTIQQLTSPEIQTFLREHLDTPPATLMLKAARYPQWPMAALATQLKALQKARTKLPLWFATPGIVYPPTLSMEQCSSQATADFKAYLINGQTGIDLTGGFGVDSAALAVSFKNWIYVERLSDLCELAQHNFTQLGLHQIEVVNREAAHFAEQWQGQADWIYLDPARRDTTQQKVVQLEDCEPNILELLPLLLQKGKNILLKASPMLDIDRAVHQLNLVSKVWVVALENECKEILFHLQADTPLEPELIAVHLQAGKREHSFTFHKSAEQAAAVQLSEPLNYIYEPNAALLKAGAFKQIASAFGLSKLHPHSHLYTSMELVAGFPGRTFKINAVSKLDKKALASYATQGKANITVRNFPLTVAEIRKKTGLKDGGAVYMFATTGLDNKAIVIVCEAV